MKAKNVYIYIFNHSLVLNHKKKNNAKVKVGVGSAFIQYIFLQCTNLSDYAVGEDAHTKFDIPSGKLTNKCLESWC